ncbi:MAG: aspartate dehydrogenase [Methanosphaera sp. rholeuAM74]|nr:MAG: aspartate dehydrogenase [Methanosphaera sp. rholeuAM74]
MKVGIIGCGAIATTLVDFKLNGKLEANLDYFYDLSYESAEELSSKIGAKAAKTLDELAENVDVILESASQSAVKNSIPHMIEKGKDVIIMSVGALLDKKFHDEILNLALKNNARIYLPTGAITGIDTVQAAKMGEITEISLTTRKPPASLDVELENDEEKVIFEGKASEAVKKFPKNINVSSTLSLASGIDVDVTIIADPKIKNNTHEINLKGTFGELTTITSNVSSANNPKTSALAAYSVASLLDKLTKTMQIGS